MNTRKLMVDSLLEYIGQLDDARYVPLEYIEGTGTQYINTGLTVAGDLDIEASIQFTSMTLESGSAPINGGYTSSSGLTYRADFAGINGDVFWVGCSTNKVDTGVPSDLLRHTFHINTATGEWGIDNVTGSVSPAVYPSNYMPILIFDRGMSQLSSYKCKERVYWVKVRKDGELVRDFVPVLRVSDNTPGLYDMAGRAFYANAGTGKFVEGPSLMPTDYRMAEHLESNGKQYIDTGVLPDFTTSVRVDCILHDAGTVPRICGAYNPVNGEGGRFHLARNTNRWHPGLGSQYGYIDGADDNRHVLCLDATAKAFYVDGVSIWTTTTNSTPALTLYIFGQNTGEPSNLCKGKLYSCDINSVANCIRNFIPVVRNSDNKPGLYDLCGSICPLTETPFYVNAGTGEFTWKELTA